MSDAAARVIPVKFSLYDGSRLIITRKVRLNVGELTIDDLQRRLQELFPAVNGPLTVRYIDEDGDLISIFEQPELDEACSYFLFKTQNLGPMRFMVGGQPELARSTANSDLESSAKSLIDTVQHMIGQASIRNEPLSQHMPTTERSTPQNEGPELSGEKGEVVAALLQAQEAIQSALTTYNGETAPDTEQGSDENTVHVPLRERLTSDDYYDTSEASSSVESLDGDSASGPVMSFGLIPNPSAYYSTPPHPLESVPENLQTLSPTSHAVDIDPHTAEVLRRRFYPEIETRPPPTSAPIRPEERSQSVAEHPATTGGDDESNEWKEHLVLIRTILPQADLRRAQILLIQYDGEVSRVIEDLMDYPDTTV